MDFLFQFCDFESSDAEENTKETENFCFPRRIAGDIKITHSSSTETSQKQRFYFFALSKQPREEERLFSYFDNHQNLLFKAWERLASFNGI